MQAPEPQKEHQWLHRLVGPCRDDDPPMARRRIGRPSSCRRLASRSKFDCRCLPCIAVPCGFTEDKLPYSIQFVGRACDDAIVLEAARRYQHRTDWHRRKPPVA